MAITPAFQAGDAGSIPVGRFLIAPKGTVFLFKMNFYSDKYARYIVNRMLRLEEGEKLTINCTEETVEFAHLVAHIASNLTSVPVSLVFIKEGKVESVDEIESEIENKEKSKGDVMLYLAPFPKFDIERELDIKALQEFRLLADPIVLDRRISIPWAVAYVPTLAWAEFVYGAGEGVDKLWTDLAALYELDEADEIDLLSTQQRALSARAKTFNALDVDTLILKGSNCNLTLKTSKGMQAITSAIRLPSGRFFYPSLPCEDLIIGLDLKGADGAFSTSLPFRFFDKIIQNSYVEIKGGKIVKFEIEGNVDLVAKYINIDPLSASVGELILCDSLSRSALFKKPLAIPVIDRMRTSTLVFGGVTPEAIKLEDESFLPRYNINNSISRLELPLGSASLSVIALTSSGKAIQLMKDGSFIN